MLKHICPLELAQDRKETQPAGDLLFPCCAYNEKIVQQTPKTILPHWHSELELFYMVQGTAEITAGEQHLRLSVGEGCCINAQQLHSIQFDITEPSEYRSLVFKSSIVAGSSNSAISIKYVQPFLEHGVGVIAFRQEAWHFAVLEWFEQAFSACAQEPVGYEITVRNTLSQILFIVQQHNENRINRSFVHKREKTVKQMLQWMDDHYEQPFSITALSQWVNYSPRECERIFRQFLFTSPKAYILKRRLFAAMDLLGNSQLSITEVAAKCGFSSHSYFTKQFRLETGYSPRDYRTIIQQSEA